MTEEEFKNQLTNEGFLDIYVQDDPASFEYPTHTHEKLTVHIILEGEMTMTDISGQKLLKAGQRFDVPAGTTHSAKMGTEGCKYIVAEK